jgi:hypothetical protein
MGIDVHIHILIPQCRFQMPLPGLRVHRVNLHKWVKKVEVNRCVSQGHLNRFEPMGLCIYIPIIDSKCRFQVPLPGWRVLRMHLHQ